MDSRSAAAESNPSYPSSPWTQSTAASSTPTTISNGSIEDAPNFAIPSHVDFLPSLLSQPQSLFQAQLFQAQLKHAQLLEYNKLISPQRGGGQPTQSPPPGPASPHISAAPRTTRSRSSSKVSNKDYPLYKANSGGNGIRAASNTGKGERGVMTGKEGPHKMAAKQGEQLHGLPPRPPPPQHGQSHSSSVPSTPHQHARNFSFETGSREPSPNATQNHSPRSAYSETSSSIPPLSRLPPRLGQCQYETAMAYSKRRIPYSIGTDRLEKIDLAKVKSKMAEDVERKLTTDMRELYGRLLPTPAVEKNRQRLVSKLETMFNNEWPGHNIRVHLFGSSGNLLCTDDSDVDICITTLWKEINVCMIAELLARHGMERVVCVSAAKVPIVKAYDTELRLACDMNVNNTMALENTRMVRTYVEIDERVRPLMMIIKHWTRRRIINDAAFGGTLSSYTWICLIIAFLQLREPHVLPALHQRLQDRLPRKGDESSSFGDDLRKLKGFGDRNKSSLGELLFQFFRFFAHEFNYEKHVLSIRQGRLLTKAEKQWNKATNNMLCCEEPFTITRNLGNTADDNAFRGLHLELRRAFDLIAEGKLEECCEQYVFPKEEHPVFMRPAPRPILLRSSSQTHNARGGRGGYRGNGRHANGFQRNGNSNRRASSAAAPYDASPMYVPAVAMTPQDLSWYQSAQVPLAYPGDLMSTALALQQAQDPNAMFRMQQMYPHAQMYQATQAQMLAQSRLPSGGVSSATSERSRTNSFDTAPLSAPPLQPELYNTFFPMHMPAFYMPAPGVGTSYPSSPATVNGGASEGFRRSLQRSAVASDMGSPGSAMRSQSQPASSLRTGQIPLNGQHASGPTSAYAGSNPSMSPFPAYNPNGVPIPSFIASDAEYDEIPQRPAAETPPSEADWSQAATGVNTPKVAQAGPAPGIAFGDINQAVQGRRRLSTDQLPQSILDRRMRRQSRSPSPLGHIRAFSVGGSPSASAPLAQMPFTPTGGRGYPRPLIVNGSAMTPKSLATPSQRQPSAHSTTDSFTSDESNTSGLENSFQSNQGLGLTLKSPAEAAVFQNVSAAEPLPPQAVDRAPVVVNGTSSLPSPAHNSEEQALRERMLRQSFNQRLAMADQNTTPRPRNASRLQQNGVIGRLDLACENRMGETMLNTDLHLSPVYETRTPSPTALRKFDPPTKGERVGGGETPSRESRAESSRNGIKASDGKQASGPGPVKTRAQSQPRQSTQGQAKAVSPIQANGPLASSQAMPPPPPPQAQNIRVNGARENGHVRAAKSESHNEGGGWQKAGKRGRKGGDKGHAATSGTGQASAENPPKLETERKGG